MFDIETRKSCGRRGEITAAASYSAALNNVSWGQQDTCGETRRLFRPSVSKWPCVVSKPKPSK